MAHFYGGIRGRAKTQTTRIGHKTTGLAGFLNGWNIGMYAELNYNQNLKSDILTIQLTRGSGGLSERLFLGNFQIIDDKITKI